MLAALGAPVVIKPRRSFVLERLERRGKVQFAHDAAEFARLQPELCAEDHVLERFFPGQGLGVSLLASHGRVLQAFEHHRVREDGSGSYYRVSAPLTPALLAACAELVAALAYTGVGMFEFRRDPRTGAWVLLEVNARPWGSMPLPLGLGVDFPWLWYRLLTAGEESPAVGYRAGVFGRNLLPDLQAVLAEAHGRGMRAVSVLARWLLELGRVATGREIHDVLVRDDPRPARGRARRGTGRGGAARGDAAAGLGGAGAPTRAGAAARGAGPATAGGVVFVCLGNICRSPFAAAALRAQPAGCGRSPSALGGHAAAAGPAHPAARRAGGGGTRHRPRRPPLDLALPRRGGGGNGPGGVRRDHAPRGAGPLSRPPRRVIKLGDLLDGADIADPIDGDARMFAATYATIAAASAALAGLLGK